MTGTATISWNKIITICSVFIIPAISILAALLIWGVRLDDKLTNVILTQHDQGNSLKELNDKVDKISVRVDTVSQRQANNKREMDYKMREMEYKRK